MCFLHLLNQFVPQRGKEMHHRQWQDTEDARLIWCIFNPKLSAPLLWNHHLQLAQVFCSLSPLFLRRHSSSSPSPQLPFITTPPSLPSSFPLQLNLSLLVRTDEAVAVRSVTDTLSLGAYEICMEIIVCSVQSLTTEGNVHHTTELPPLTSTE